MYVSPRVASFHLRLLFPFFFHRHLINNVNSSRFESSRGEPVRPDKMEVMHVLIFFSISRYVFLGTWAPPMCDVGTGCPTVISILSVHASRGASSGLVPRWTKRMGFCAELTCKKKKTLVNWIIARLMLAFFVLLHFLIRKKVQQKIETSIC